MKHIQEHLLHLTIFFAVAIIGFKIANWIGINPSLSEVLAIIFIFVISSLVGAFVHNR